MHSKGNHTQNEKKKNQNLQNGENIHNWYDQQRLNFPNIQIAHTAQYLKKLPNQIWAEDLSRHF